MITDILVFGIRGLNQTLAGKSPSCPPEELGDQLNNLVLLQLSYQMII